MTSTVYDQKVKCSHEFFKSRILQCVFLRAERLFLFKTMNIKGRKNVLVRDFWLTAKLEAQYVFKIWFSIVIYFL